MSSVKRKRIRSNYIPKTLGLVFKDGFHRVIIKSEDNNRFLGVYYITPGGEYLKNMTDVINWLETKTDTTLKRIHFSFISKKITDLTDEEYIIHQNELPTELLDYVLEKKRSIAPGIISVGNDISNQSFDVSEPSENELPKRIKLEDINPSSEVVDFRKNEISLNDVTFITREKLDYPEISISQQHIFEASLNCHSQRLIDCMNLKFHHKTNQLQRNCDNTCAFDNFGSPRFAFECDFCLILWHMDCSGYRWLSIDTVRLLMCDNCAILREIINCSVPNLFCDIEKIFETETKIQSRANNVEIRVPAKLDPVLRLLKFQWMMHKNTKGPSSSSTQAGLNFQKPPGPTRKRFARKDFGKWKHVFETMVGPDSVVSESQETLLRVRFGLKAIDQLVRILADRECQLLVDDNPVQVNATRIVVQKDTLLIPVESMRISRDCQAIFYSLERQQDRCTEYRDRCVELRASMTAGLYGVTGVTPVTTRPAVTLTKTATRDQYGVPVTLSSLGRPVQITPITPITATNCFKIVPSNRVFMPRSNCSTTFTGSGLGPIGTANPPALIKLRQRKQDLGFQKMHLRVHNYMRMRQWNLLNLPFELLERILSCPSLSTIDKLNCRLAHRILKCIIDGGQVWNKIVICPSTVTGLDNMMSFFRSRVVRKITFLIDFQESFVLDFLTYFVSHLKMYPDNMNIERLSIKFTGSPPANSPWTLSVQAVLSCCKSITALSISSEVPIALELSRKKLSSNTIVKLKLKNILNISSIIQTNTDCVPNLTKLFSGDWSFANNMDPFHLTKLTTLHLYFSESVQLVGITALSSLINLEYLTVSRPLISDSLVSLVSYVLKSRKLVRFNLKVLIPVDKQTHDSCFQLASCFDKVKVEVYWHLRFDSLVTDSVAMTLVNQLHGVLSKNVWLASARADPHPPIDPGLLI